MSIFIQDFKYGMDRRRARVAGVPGTLWIGKNVHISRGGDIERPKKFATAYNLPAGQTFGLAAVKGQLYTFGSVSTPAGIPPGVQYLQCAAPGGLSSMTEVLDARPVDGKFYVIARFGDGNVFHFYDGTWIPDWDTVVLSNGNMAGVAEYIAGLINADANVSATVSGLVITITAKVPGTAFTISRATFNGGSINDQDITLSTVQANVVAVTEVRATGSVTITGGTAGKVSTVTVDGANILGAAVTWVGSNNATANAVAASINNRTSDHGFSAAAAGAVVTITAEPGSGATVNDQLVDTTTTGDVTTTTTRLLGGVTAVAAVAQIVTATFTGTFEIGDIFSIVINSSQYIATSRASAVGTSILVYKKRVFSAAGSLLMYSKLNVFNNFTDSAASSGAGFINVSTDAEGTERLVGAAPYQDQMAIFSRRNIRLYNITTDAQETTIDRSIDNSGAVSLKSILSYGNIDTFYLDETGVRSLRAHEQNAQAFVNDIGTAIDPFVREHMDSLPNATIIKAVAGIEPREGRFMLALGMRVYVLSYFPQSEISAWSYYEPGFQITDMVRAYNRLYVRSGDTVYLYGGASGSEYPGDDEMIAEVQLPFIATVPPAREKMMGVDIACTNEWFIQAAVDPNNENALIDVGRPRAVTYNQESMSTPGRTSHIGLKLTCSRAGAATISNINIKHTESDSRG